MPALNVVTVDPDELAVDIDLSQRGGATVTAYTDATGATPISLPATITARTEFWLPVNADYTFIVSAGGAERYRTTVGVSDRTDDPKTLLLRDVLSLGDAAAGAGGGSGASVPTDEIWLEQNTPQTLADDPNSSTTTITLETDAAHVGTAMTSDGTGIVVHQDGTYAFDATVYFASHADAAGRGAGWQSNDPGIFDTPLTVVPAINGGQTVVSISWTAHLSSGSTMRVRGGQHSGGNLALDYATLHGKLLG